MNKSTLGVDLEGEENVIEPQHYPVVEEDISHEDTGRKGKQISTVYYSNTYD